MAETEAKHGKPLSHPLLFPDRFIWGVSTSAYQIEGAWKTDGKGESVWDRFSHTDGTIRDGSTGDVACDHYHRYREDVSLLSDLGVEAYRFSLSWPRIMPAGDGTVEIRGLDFYDRLVDRLLEGGITPWITLFHWDTPSAVEDRGGWTNRTTASLFADYAALVVRRLGDRVFRWITLNEPLSVTGAGYLAGTHAPGRRSPVAAARAAHVFLLAHGLARCAIRSEQPDAAIGIANSFAPVYPHRHVDERAARLVSAVLNELFMDPLYFGRYPRVLSPLIHLLNRHIRPGDWDIITGAPDFIGVNHYSRFIAQRTLFPYIGFRLLRPLYEQVLCTDMEWEVYPPGFYRILRWIRERYNNPPVVVTENGAAYDDPVIDGVVADRRRIDYLRRYLQELHRAIHNGQEIRGYFVWSLRGCGQKLGLLFEEVVLCIRMKRE
jgi:beta-glucosidase